MKTYNGTDFPTLEPHQFSLMQAELRTGIILDLDGKRRDKRYTNDWILIFESLEEAELFAEKRIAQLPNVECWVQNYNGEYKKRIFKE